MGRWGRGRGGGGGSVFSVCYWHVGVGVPVHVGLEVGGRVSVCESVLRWGCRFARVC